MNKIFEDKHSKVPISIEELQAKYPILLLDPTRIAGRHCECPENKGEFVLLPDDDEMVIEGGKNYMQCRVCGAWSHL